VIAPQHLSGNQYYCGDRWMITRLRAGGPTVRQPTLITASPGVLARREWRGFFVGANSDAALSFPRSAGVPMILTGDPAYVPSSPMNSASKPV